MYLVSGIADSGWVTTLRAARTAAHITAEPTASCGIQMFLQNMDSQKLMMIIFWGGNSGKASLIAGPLADLPGPRSQVVHPEVVTRLQCITQWSSGYIIQTFCIEQGHTALKCCSTTAVSCSCSHQMNSPATRR